MTPIPSDMPRRRLEVARTVTEANYAALTAFADQAHYLMGASPPAATMRKPPSHSQKSPSTDSTTKGTSNSE